MRVTYLHMATAIKVLLNDWFQSSRISFCLMLDKFIFVIQPALAITGIIILLPAAFADMQSTSFLNSGFYWNQLDGLNLAVEPTAL